MSAQAWERTLLGAMASAADPRFLASSLYSPSLFLFATHKDTFNKPQKVGALRMGEFQMRLLQLNQKVKSIEGMRRNIYWITYNLQQVLKKYNYWASYGDQGFFSDALHTETLFNLHLLRSTLQPLVQGTGKKTWKDKRDKENKVTKKKRMKADTFLYHFLTTLA